MPMSPLSPVSTTPGTVSGASPSRRTRPGRSVNHSFPSLSKAIDHTVSSPVARSEVASRTGPCAVWVTTVVSDGTTPPELSFPSSELQAAATTATARRTEARRREWAMARMVRPSGPRPRSVVGSELAEHLLQVVEPRLVDVLDGLLGVLGAGALGFEPAHPLDDRFVALLMDFDGRVVVGHRQRAVGDRVAVAEGLVVL